MLPQVIDNSMQINRVGTEGPYLIRTHTDNMVVRMHVNGGSMRMNHLWSGNGLGRSRGCLEAYLPDPPLRLANLPMPLAAWTLAGLALAHGTNTLVRRRATCPKHKVGSRPRGGQGKYSPRRDQSGPGDDGLSPMNGPQPLGPSSFTGIEHQGTTGPRTAANHRYRRPDSLACLDPVHAPSGPTAAARSFLWISKCYTGLKRP